ncbi:MAG: hypothetical protein OXK82_02620 [Deltaproteobacteria bacterium]|nr:hypothetical protein [Deltaproteobacteria bacterium]
MTEVVALVTSIAACLSAIAALVVVRQNYKQRTASYRPDLIFVERTVRLQSFEQSGGMPQLSDEDGESQILVPIVNVGLGAARDLKVSWQFPIDQMISCINLLAQQSLVPAYYEHKNGFLSLESKMSWAVRWGREEEIGYVLPALISETAPKELSLPKAYVALVFGHYHFALQAHRSDKSDAAQLIDIPDLPKLKCQIDYGDIGGLKHRLEVMVSVAPVVISKDHFECVVRILRCNA